VGTQIACLSISNTGSPSDVTLTAEVTNCAVTHGPFPAVGGGMAQPATMYGAATVTIGCPLTITLGCTTVGVACPPCAQVTVAPR
jgi:hypothetical protein